MNLTKLINATAANTRLSAIGADNCQHRPYLATHLWFSGLTVSRIVKHKTKSINFILNTIGRADIAPNIPTALSGAVNRNAFRKAFIITSLNADLLVY